MKKIIFTVTNDLTYDQRMDRICTTLAAEGYEVLIVGRKKKNSLSLKKKTYGQKRLNCIFNKGKLFYLEYNIRLFFFLLLKKSDIISAVDLDTALPAFFVSKIRSKKFVYDAHEYFTEVIEVVERPFVKKIWTWIESFILPRTKYAYTVSESLKKLYEEKYPVKFEVIRNISLLEEYDPQEKKEKYLIYIGAVNAGRGLEELIEAMPEINCKLYICGDGDILEDIKLKTESLSLTGKVMFTGYTEPEKLKELTRNAYIGVILLKNISLSYYYSLANKFFDYIHAGIPQVAIDFPEYMAINERHKVAELTDLKKENIIRSVNKLLNNEEYYNELKENTFRARIEFNWQKESAKLVEFYKNII